MSDKTISLIMKHWTDKEAFQGDSGTLDLPFNIEQFCLENDQRIKDLEGVVKEFAKVGQGHWAHFFTPAQHKLIQEVVDG